ncbi:MAG: hypothetical protein OJI67_24400, partial [Prosthecobacter sp.]|nr:hypothetical protein [Prosthecobacter sp.]
MGTSVGAQLNYLLAEFVEADFAEVAAGDGGDLMVATDAQPRGGGGVEGGDEGGGVGVARLGHEDEL